MSNDNKMTNIYTGYTLGDLVSYEGSEPYIFISYSHADTDEVYSFLKYIEREKFRFWYDDTMEIGEDFREELRTKIEGCSAFLLFISKASMNSKYCGMEIITAYKNNKKIYPIYLDENVEIPPAFKMILENIQHVKGYSSSGMEKYVQKLITGLPIETMRSLEVEGDVLVKCKDGSDAITIPGGVRVIGESAFKNCERLVRVNFGEEVEVIRREAFRGCKSIEEIHLPKNVRFVGDSTFRDCISLKKLVIDNKDIEIGERAFENCALLSEVSLRNEMKEIYGGVFNSCKSLAHIDLPEMLTILGESCFADCIALKEVKIPSKVTKIDDIAFNGCIELENVILPENLLKIGKSTFKDCSSLKSIHIPASLLSIGSGPFRGCTNLESIEVDPKNRAFKSVDNVLFNKNKSILVSYPPKLPAEEYSIPDSVVTISDWAFCGCTNLKRIEIPDSVSEIGEGAFYMCENLEELIIPDSVVKIDDIAFRGCVSLKRIVMPDSVREFGWGLFNGDGKLTVECSDDSPAAKYCETKYSHPVD
ncbi:MAG: leucine-rich repeat protein [Clostridia bacterium]|nr:leucine-rich repeat protein [Clostridia bacterium]